LRAWFCAATTHSCAITHSRDTTHSWDMTHFMYDRNLSSPSEELRLYGHDLFMCHDSLCAMTHSCAITHPRDTIPSRDIAHSNVRHEYQTCDMTISGSSEGVLLHSYDSFIRHHYDSSIRHHYDSSIYAITMTHLYAITMTHLYAITMTHLYAITHPRDMMVRFWNRTDSYMGTH